MSGEKTEEPTAKKLRDSRLEGQVAHSKDFTQTLLILAMFGYMLANAESIIADLGALMVLPTPALSMDFEAAANAIIIDLLKDAAAILLPFLLIGMAVGLLGETLQVGLVFAFKALKIKGDKLNPAANVKNVFSMKNLMEFIKSNLKIAFLSALLYFLIRDAFPTLMVMPVAGLAGVGLAVGMLLKTMLINIGVAYMAIALADLVWQRFNHRKQMMMSKDEVKQEYKQMEGDPHIKHQRKHLHQEMLMEGAVEKTRKASVLVTNPTHYAIAIRYEEDETPLPVVLAKGEGWLAERMIKAAVESGVPVMQNIPLAHALMDQASVDRYIPSELIEAVGEVLRLVRKMREGGHL